MGAKRKTTQVAGTEEVKIVEPVEAEVAEETTVSPEETVETATEETLEASEKKPTKKQSTGRSKRYLAVRAKVDKTKKYDPFAAVELVKRLSYSKFDGTMSAHLVVKEAGISAALTLPHSTGKSIRVAIVSDDVLKNIEAGNIDFDILVASPEFMGKLAKFAPVLGPKGLMPNPKNGTLTKDTEGQKKKLEAGTITVKTEKKAPLMHIRLGKTSMDTKKLVENLETVIKTLGHRLERITIASTMSPGVKVDAAAITTA